MKGARPLDLYLTMVFFLGSMNSNLGIERMECRGPIAPKTS